MEATDDLSTQPLLMNEESPCCEGCMHPMHEKASANTPRSDLLQVTSMDHKDNGGYGDVCTVKGIGDNPSMQCGTVCRLSNPEDVAIDAVERSKASRKLSFAIGFCLLFMAVEIAGGLVANSLAILTDAAHLLSDVAGFAISLFSIWAASWEATPRQTYGFHRLEILGALVSIQLIWLLTGIIVYEAFDRMLHSSQPVDGRLMFIVAALGFLVNLAMLTILGHGHQHDHKHGNNHDHEHGHQHEQGHADEHGFGHTPKKAHFPAFDREISQTHRHGHHHNYSTVCHIDCCSPKHTSFSHSRDSHVSSLDNNLSDDGRLLRTARSVKIDQDLDKRAIESVENFNARGAYLHVFGDLIQSIGVMVAGALIWYNPSWRVVDLACTLLFSLLVLGTTIKMLRDIVEVLMESTPREIDTTKLEEGLREIPKVVAVHELHIWAITVGKTLLACHVRIQPDGNADLILQRVVQFCSSKFKISHVTVQIERDLED